MNYSATKFDRLVPSLPTEDESVFSAIISINKEYQPMLTYATVCSGIECMSVACRGLPLKPVFFSEIEPYPCAVLRAHYPDVPNLGDMSKIQASNNGLCITNGTCRISLDKPMDILAGGTPCFVAGTMILTPKGYVPIETLRVGDEVISGSGQVRKVEATGSKMAKVGTLKVLGRPEIVCTPNHPFFSINMKRDNRRGSNTYSKKIPVGDYEETRADELTGKYVGRVISHGPSMEPIVYPKCWNATCDDIMELAGWYLGDGYIRKFTGKSKKSVVFALCCRKKISKFKERFGKIVHICDGGDGKLVVNCTELADWLLANFGEHSAEKRIPYWCYACENTRYLLAGYEATDGWTHGIERKFCTVSPALAYGIADLLGSASVCFWKVNPRGLIQGREVSQRDCYQVKSTSKTIRTKFINGRYASIARSYNGAEGIIQRVYNITVADEHTYIANGLWCHNCQDVSVAGKRRGFDPEGRQTRSSLAFDFVRLARELGPKYVLWENVAGSIDSKNGPDFLKFLSALGDCGYSIAWRVLDAQYVTCSDIYTPDGRMDIPLSRAVPQRRRRVWVLGVRSLGRAGANATRAAEVLFEPDRSYGDSAPRRETRKGIACTPEGRDRLDAGLVGEASGIVSFGETGRGYVSELPVAETMRVGGGNGFGVGNLVVCLGKEAYNSGEKATGSMNISTDNVAQSVRADMHPSAIAIDNDSLKMGDVARTITGDHNDRVTDTGTSVLVSVGFKPGQSGREDTGSLGAQPEQSPTLPREPGGMGIGVAIASVEPQVCKTLSAEGFDGMPDVTRQNGQPVVTVAVRTANTHANGHGIATETSHTLDCAAGQAIVCGVDSYNQTISPEVMHTLHHHDELDNQPKAILNYIVRRLTPMECERLMGLPDGYTIPVGLDPNDPALVAEFQRIFDTFGAIMYEYALASYERSHREGEPPPKPPKPKSANQVRKWLTKITDPKTCPDSPRYKACGNGWATNQPRWILARLLELDEQDNREQKD